MFIVYAIYNSKHNKIYIGQTRDINLRLKMHSDKIFHNSYTSRFDGSWEVVYTEKLPDRFLALKREKQLKSYRGRQFIKNQIPG
ncbi:MAG: GIY-YIG nuclease family protein [Candidatus Vogelbacteria bacterium]|nr:GIY-YIG nuclease family protein [Candidatus Vogelbacteria bacterium]